MKPTDLLWLFLPEDFFPLLIVGLATLSIVGLVRPGRVITMLLLVLMLPVISIVVEGILAQLPWYVGALILLALVTNVARLVIQVFVGREAAGHILGHAVLALFRGTFYIVTLPVRWVARWAR